MEGPELVIQDKRSICLESLYYTVVFLLLHCKHSWLLVYPRLICFWNFAAVRELMIWRRDWQPLEILKAKPLPDVIDQLCSAMIFLQGCI